MKIDVTDVSPVKKTMSIEVGAETVAKEVDRLLAGYAKQMKVPGFRAGKAPLSVVRARMTPELQQDVKEQLVSRFYRQAADEEGLHPISDPLLDEVSYQHGEPLKFKTTFEVRPKFELKDYKGVEARKKKVQVGPADVDKVLEDLQQSRTQLVSEEKETPAATGHIVVADLEGTPGEGEPFKQERAMIEIGAPDQLPAFNEGLTGAKSGDELDFTVDYPKEYPTAELAGQQVRYRMTVHEIKRKQVPEVDDEFAKDLGDFDDLAALRTRIHEDLEKRRQHEVEQEVRQSVLDKVLLANPIVLPDSWVEQEIRSRLEDLARNLIMQGVDPEQAKIDWKEVWEKQDAPARKTVHARLILDAVGEAEGVEVTDDVIRERIDRDAQRLGENPEKLRQRLKKGAGVEALRAQLVREKSLDLLTDVANIQIED